METRDFTRSYSRKVLNKALSDLVSSKQTQRDDPEVKDVGQATKAMVWKLVKEVTRDNTNYTVSDILDAGSYYEGTKLGFPDEFDFMIVFEIGDFEVKTGYAKGLVEIQLINDGGRRDAGKNGAYVKSLTGRFRHLITALVSDLVYTNQTIECQGDFGLVSLGHSSYPTLQLKWTNTQTRKTTRIKIDLMPAIRCPEEYMGQLLDIILRRHLHIIEKQGLHLVPKSCSRCPDNSCWHISFARAEAFLMKQLDALHKAAYRTLKFLIQIKQPDVDEVMGAITSYSIKNALLHHVLTFGCTNLSDLGGCLMRILHYIDQCYQDLNMPLFFMNTWCMFRLGSLAYCKLESVTVVQELKPETKGLLLHDDKGMISLSRQTVAHCTWEFLIWIEYQRRYVALILSVLENAMSGKKLEHSDDENSRANFEDETDKDIERDSETARRCLESLVSLATLYQPACALTFDFNENDGLIIAMKNERLWIYINDFQDLKDETEKLFGFKCEVWNADNIWPALLAEGVGRGNMLSKNTKQSIEAIIYARNRETLNSNSNVTAQSSVADRNCFEFLPVKYPGDILKKSDSAIAIATVRSTKLTPQMYLVQFDLKKCKEESLSQRRFFHCLNQEIFGSEDYCCENELNDDDMDAYLSLLVQDLEAQNLNEDSLK